MRRRALLILALVLGLPLPLVATTATAATLSGTTSGPQGEGIPAEVRLWTPGEKGWTIAHEVIAGANGSYSFTGVATGEYRISARMAPGFSGDYGDTWYDVDPPSSDGLFASDADILEVTSGDNLTGLDITLPYTGGFNGVIHGNLGPLSTVWVRAESTTDRRHHHNDLTKSYFPRFGEFHFRGLREAHDFRVLVYDPQGRYETYVGTSEQSVTNGQYPDIGTITLTPLAADPYGNNNTAATATEVGSLPFATEGAAIFPRGSDVDWYCMDVEEGDRLVARAESTLEIGGEVRQHPWFDPILSFWDGDGTTMIAHNDDDPAGGTLAAFIDTGILEAGRYCFVVSTFGDSDWTGTGQQTAGSYEFSVEPGNRPPFIEVTYDGGALPSSLTVEEGEELVFDIVYGDPDGDPVTPEVFNEGSDGNPADGGDLDVSQGTGTYTWTVPFTAAPHSPYEITFFIDDGEFSEEVTITIHVEGVNNPPSTPVPIFPVGGLHVDTHEVTLRIQNSVDLDGDDLLYEFEVHHGPVDGDPDQAASVMEDPSGQTEWTTSFIDENTFAAWRVRAFDGDPDNGYSAWSDWENFRIDTQNMPPSTPEIVKPEQNELVLVLTPRIASTVPEDPEGDPVTVYFELSEDSNFDDLFADSGPVPVNGNSDRVEWTTSRTLSTGQRYYVRAMATDNRNGESPWSDVVSFRTRPDEFLRPPNLDQNAFCDDQHVNAGSIPEFLVVQNIDESGDALTFELQITEHGEVIYEVEQPQSEGTTTEIPLDTSLGEGYYRINVRTVLDDDHSEWVECSMMVEGSGDGDGDGDGDGGSGDGGDGDGDRDRTASEAGCACSASNSGAPAMAWTLALLFLVFGRRRRSSQRS